MIELNEIIHASTHTQKCVERLLSEFDGHLYGAEMGIAYGGGIQKIGTRWKDRGTVWGFDTFEGHPREVADICPDTIMDGGQKSHAANCMDFWYRRGGEFAVDHTAYDYIRGELDKEGLDNVILCKGLITQSTDLWFIPKLHYVLLDLDYPLSMRQAYELVKNKIVPCGYLCLHDVLPEQHLHGLYSFYQEIIASGLFSVVSEHPECYLAVLKKNA